MPTNVDLVEIRALDPRRFPSDGGLVHIAVDMTRCQSYAQCCFLAPDAFRFEGEEALVYDPQPSDADRLKVLQAAAACPVQAIRVDHRDLEPRSTGIRTTHRSPTSVLGASTEVVVVGASLAGVRAAEALREEGFMGRLTVIGDEPHAPYDRPPLSKQVLTGMTSAMRTTLPIGRDLEAEWRLGTVAAALDLERDEVVLVDGERVRFDRLVIATGTRARPWAVPHEADLDGVVTLRTDADAADLRRRLQRGPRRVLVIGGGFTGSEVASSCRSLGLEVTVVDRGPAPLARALGRPVGDVAAGLQREHGVDLRSSTQVTALHGDADGRLERATLSDGTTIDIDVAVVAIGAIGNVEWLEGSGLDIDPRGVACDGSTRAIGQDGAALERVFVAGDVARFPHPRFGPGLLTMEHWGNAVAQAEVAAHNLATGASAPHDSVPVFWSIQFGHAFKSVGVPSIADEMVFVQGSAATRSFVAVYGARGRIVAAVALDQPKWLDHYRRLIEDEASFPPRERMVDASDERTPIPLRIPEHAR